MIRKSYYRTHKSKPKLGVSFTAKTRRALSIRIPNPRFLEDNSRKEKVRSVSTADVYQTCGNHKHRISEKIINKIKKVRNYWELKCKLLPNVFVMLNYDRIDKRYSHEFVDHSLKGILGDELNEELSNNVNESKSQDYD